jgi:hypothetical protein
VGTKEESGAHRKGIILVNNHGIISGISKELEIAPTRRDSVVKKRASRALEIHTQNPLHYHSVLGELRGV